MCSLILPWVLTALSLCWSQPRCSPGAAVLFLGWGQAGVTPQPPWWENCQQQLMGSQRVFAKLRVGEVLGGCGQ